MNKMNYPMQQLEMMYQQLPPPRNQMAHLLYEMIQGKMISEREFEYNRFRGSISDLINEHQCPIRHQDVKFTSKFGKGSYYRRHYIMTIDRGKAIEIYQRINQ